MMYVFWALVGWCGTPPGKGPIIPDPDPEPWWMSRIAGLVGGILGGILVQRMLNSTDTGAVSIIATSIGAFAVGRVLGDIVSNVVGGSRRGVREVNVGP